MTAGQHPGDSRLPAAVARESDTAMSDPSIAASLIDSPVWRMAGWTMLHFLWVGSAIGVVAAAGRFVLRAASPSARYAFALACLVALCAAPIAGAIAWAQLAGDSPATLAAAPAADEQQTPTDAPPPGLSDAGPPLSPDGTPPADDQAGDSTRAPEPRDPLPADSDGQAPAVPPTEPQPAPDEERPLIIERGLPRNIPAGGGGRGSFVPLPRGREFAAPDSTITIELAGVPGDAALQPIQQRLKGMTDPYVEAYEERGASGQAQGTRSGQGHSMSVSGGVAKITLAPVRDVRGFADRIDFGEVTSVDVERRTIRVTYRHDEAKPQPK